VPTIRYPYKIHMAGMMATPGNENTPVQRHCNFNNLRIFSEEGKCPAAWALHIACYAVLRMSISLTVSAQEQSHPAQAPQQEESKSPDASVEPERWNLFYQATSIGQYHGTLNQLMDAVGLKAA
jgi:hypothetical protein